VAALRTASESERDDSSAPAVPPRGSDEDVPGVVAGAGSLVSDSAAVVLTGGWSLAADSSAVGDGS